MKALYFLILFSFNATNCQKLAGFNFLDNNSTSPYIPENGRMFVFYDQIYSRYFSLCFKINIRFQRYNDYDQLFYIGDELETTVIKMVVASQEKRFTIFYNDIRQVNWAFEDNHIDAHLFFLGKWVWYCFVLNLEDLPSSKMFMSGMELVSTPFEVKD